MRGTYILFVFSPLTSPKMVLNRWRKIVDSKSWFKIKGKERREQKYRMGKGRMWLGHRKNCSLIEM